MKKVSVILVCSPDTSEMSGVRRHLRTALQSLTWMPVWQELMAGDNTLPVRYRSQSAPFVLAHGKFVAIDEPDIIAAHLQQHYNASRKWAWLHLPLATGSAIPGILMAFFPKCAGCWVAYASLLGSVGTGLPYMPWMRHVLAGMLVLSAFYFARMAMRRHRWIPFWFQLPGFAAVLTSQYIPGTAPLLWLGVALVFAGSLLYAMPDAWMRKLERHLRPEAA